MTIEELKEKGVYTTGSVIEHLSRNNRGSYFLPENLAELIADIAKSNFPKSCIDLNSNIGEILSKCNGIETNLGLDINQENIELANYLNPSINFENTNPLNYYTKDKFDVIICFPPLGQRIEINGRKTLSDKLYVSKSLELLKDNGKVILILPNKFLTAPNYAETRKLILNNYGIKQIVSLPQRILKNTGIELSIIEVVNKPIEEINFLKIKTVNFIFKDIIAKKPDFTVSKDNLNERWDYKFHNPINKEYEKN